MNRYRNHLPQLTQGPFITDGGLETTLIYHHGYDLPEFAAFDLLARPQGFETLRDYYLPYVALSRKHGTGFVLESPTWRASRGWGEKLGYSVGDLRDVNRQSIAMLEDVRRKWAAGDNPVVISGCIGPRRDGYRVTEVMSAEDAEGYHSEQIAVLSETAADQVSAFTINTTEEAVGITRAAQKSGIPAVISFTVETDGRLPSGVTLAEAVSTVDRETGRGPAYYMINCAHPTHFEDALAVKGDWRDRIRAVRANASDKSHEELDASSELDDGNPVELGGHHAELTRLLPNLNVFGGCCGTDHRHVEAIFDAVAGHA